MLGTFLAISITYTTIKNYTVQVYLMHEIKYYLVQVLVAILFSVDTIKCTFTSKHDIEIMRTCEQLFTYIKFKITSLLKVPS